MRTTIFFAAACIAALTIPTADAIPISKTLSLQEAEGTCFAQPIEVKGKGTGTGKASAPTQQQTRGRSTNVTPDPPMPTEHE